MIVFHGSNLAVQKPEVIYSKSFLDFGKGFYTTTYQHQAEQWALRKAIRQGKEAIVSVYDFQECVDGYNLLLFKDEDEKWLDFVCECRNGNEINKKYDIISGNVADDDVFKTADLYFRGIWSKEKALDEIRYYKMNNQICFVSQNVLDDVLLFKESYQVVK